MKIHDRKVEDQGLSTVISCRIDSGQPQLPTRMWYEIPSKYKNRVARTLDPFLIPLILLSMKLKEDIEIVGDLSKGLIENLHEYQRSFHHTFLNTRLLR